MVHNHWALYDGLIAGIPEDLQVVKCNCGYAWTGIISSEEGMGLAMTTYGESRPFSTDGHAFIGMPLKELAAYAKSWNFIEAGLGAKLEIIDNSQSFGDVPGSFWAAGAVNFVTSREIFTGTSNTQFSPNSSMNRAMLMTVLYRLEGGKASTTGENWYADALNWSKDQGLSDGSNPTGQLTREQLAAILYRYADSPNAGGSLSSFSDQNAASDWAIPTLSWAVEEGLLSGQGNGLLAPGGSATRAEVAAILQRFLAGNTQS